MCVRDEVAFHVQRPLVFPFLGGSGVCVRVPECVCVCVNVGCVSVVSTFPGMLTQEWWTWSQSYVQKAPFAAV